MSAPRFRWAWWVLAYASFGIGLVGIVLPILPTAPFILVAAYAAARGSQRLHAWLLAHRIWGPMITDWESAGAIARPAKWLATATMAICAVILFVVAPIIWVAVGVTTFMACVATWIWLRPEPEPPSDDLASPPSRRPSSDETA